MARFVAIDVETANSRRSSICQIGLVVYENRKIVDEWTTLVNPEDEFNVINVGIHGIGRKSIQSAPTLPEVFMEMQRRFAGACVASYGDFDRSALSQAATRYGLSTFEGQWLDLQHVVKGAWPAEFSTGGWALKKVCARLGIELFNHHEALADARAAGDVFVKAQETTNTWARDWLGMGGATTTGGSRLRPEKVAAAIPNSSGPLAGTRIVFTGELAMPRGVAEAKAASLGCRCTSGVSKKTDFVVVGDQDLSLVGPDGMSTKQRKAAQLQAAGAPIKILDAAEFEALLRQYGHS
ncbi:exonuclease domain-containing protein [Variovorax sp. J22R24]|uniref:exonuclease domain-containing protein n=1 Tax=Variovorax gracilis TaxID=3053502 RepID=UPI0025768957|nr:exonuclease domain-containing protein [Variovorax sp. J22R24]MDM0110076.1 exonuclease domain-containing protein [Variovorax sp. J22R24]